MGIVPYERTVCALHSTERGGIPGWVRDDVGIVPYKETGGAFHSTIHKRIRGLCGHFSLLTRQGGYGIVDNQSEVPSHRGAKKKYIDKSR